MSTVFKIDSVEPRQSIFLTVIMETTTVKNVKSSKLTKASLPLGQVLVERRSWLIIKQRKYSQYKQLRSNFK